MDIGKDSSQKLTDLNYELGDGSFPLAQQLAEVSPAVLENFGEDTEALATLSPYQTEHINRFGKLQLSDALKNLQH